jgi:hypothetical protein
LVKFTNTKIDFLAPKDNYQFVSCTSDSSLVLAFQNTTSIKEVIFCNAGLRTFHLSQIHDNFKLLPNYNQVNVRWRKYSLNRDTLVMIEKIEEHSICLAKIKVSQQSLTLELEDYIELQVDVDNFEDEPEVIVDKHQEIFYLVSPEAVFVISPMLEIETIPLKERREGSLAALLNDGTHLFIFGGLCDDGFMNSYEVIYLCDNMVHFCSRIMWPFT